MYSMWDYIGMTLPMGFIVLGIVIANYNKTRVKIAELRAQNPQDDTLRQDVHAIREEMGRLSQQMSQLRDTSTQYDLSLDQALQQMEQRVEHLENRTFTASRRPLPISRTYGKAGNRG